MSNAISSVKTMCLLHVLRKGHENLCVRYNIFSSNNVFNHMSVDVCESEIATLKAISETFMVDAQKV